MAYFSQTGEVADDLRENVRDRASSDKVPAVSEAALNSLEDKVDGYAQQLISEAASIARLNRADSISAIDVERAASRLGPSSQGLFAQSAGTLGGVFLGASLSTFLSMAAANTFLAVPTLVSAALGIAGGFLVAVSLTKGVAS